MDVRYLNRHETRNQKGRDAENRALEWFLLHRRARLLIRNYRRRYGEIDLIFEEEVLDSSDSWGSRNSNQNFHAQELVFVEVRLRLPGGLVDGPESLDWKKQRSLQRAAERFLWKYRGKARTIRFDLLSWDGTAWTHLQGIRLGES